jgi:hypothetical protein
MDSMRWFFAKSSPAGSENLSPSSHFLICIGLEYEERSNHLTHYDGISVQMSWKTST